MSALLYVIAAIAILVGIRRLTNVRAASLTVLLLLPLAVTGGAMLRGAVLGPIDLAYTAMPLSSVADAVGIHYTTNPGISDVYTEFFPWNAALRFAVGHGEWPLWNPFELCGSPLAAAVQSSPYHPITLLALLLPQPDGITFTAAMALLLAALSTFLYIRDLGVAELPALVGAAGWMFSTHIVFYLGTALVLAYAAMPLALLGARMVARRPGFSSATVLTIALLLDILAGHPESSLHIVSLAVIVFVVEAASVRFRDARRMIVAGLGAGIATLLLSAIFLLPMFDALAQTEEYRHRRRDDEFVSQIATTRVIAHHLRANFTPYAEGQVGLEGTRHEAEIQHGWMPSAYVGSVVMALAVLGLWQSSDRRKWLALAFVMWGLAAGANAPGFAQLMRTLPLFDIAVNDRMIGFAAFGFAVLAAFGCQVILATDQRRKAVGAIALAGAAFLIAGAVMFRALADADLAVDFIATGIARQVIPLALAAVAVATLRSSRLAIITILLLITIQRRGESHDLQPVIDRKAFYPKFAGLELLKHPESFRIVAFGDVFTPAISTHYRLEDVRGFQAMTFDRLFETFPLWSVPLPLWSNRVDDVGVPFMSLMNVRYALTHPRPIPDGWKLLARMPRYDVLENTRVLSRAFVPATVHFVAERGALKELSGGRDFAREAWIEQSGPPQTLPNGPGTIRTTNRGTGLRLQATMHGAGWVIVSESAWRGWRAMTGGRQLPLRIANHAFLAFHLPAGEHTIDLVYRPTSFVIGALISAVTAIALVFMMVLRSRTLRESPAASGPQSG